MRKSSPTWRNPSEHFIRTSADYADMMDVPLASSSDDREVREGFDRAVSLMEASPLDPEAIAILRSNMDKGCTASMVRLGVAFADGDEDQKKESVELFRKAADLGDSSGVRNLAYCYAIGLNCEKDKAKGAELYEKAAGMGNAKAMCNIGVMYDYGNGVDEDPEKAFQWYKRSAEGGYSRGMTNLGELYMWGRGTEKDLDQAVVWLERSGTPRAEYRLAEICLDELKDCEKGMEHLKNAADRGYSKALYRYGSMTEAEDRLKAVDMYTQAARKGNSDAISRLEELGEPVPEPSFKKKRRKS